MDYCKNSIGKAAMRCKGSHRSPALMRKARAMLLSCGDALIDFLPVKSVDGRDAIVPVAGGSCLNIAVGMGRPRAPAGVPGGHSTQLFCPLISRHPPAPPTDPSYSRGTQPP